MHTRGMEPPILVGDIAVGDGGEGRGRIVLVKSPEFHVYSICRDVGTPRHGEAPYLARAMLG